MIVYKVTNIINHKSYIGQTIYDLDYRKKRHFIDTARNSNTHFHRAIKKHGERAFEWMTIAITTELEMLNILEKFYIEKYDSFHNGYNMTTGGGNYEISDEYRQKLSESHSGEKHYLYGKHHTEETKQKISEAHKGLPIWNKDKHLTNEHRQKIGKAHIGKKHTKETKQKISTALKNKPSTLKNTKQQKVICPHCGKEFDLRE